MRITEGKHHGFAFDLRAVSDPHNVQVLFKALGNPPHRVGQEAAGQAVQCRLLAALPFNHVVAVLLLKVDARRYGHPEGSFRSLYHHSFPIRLHRYAGGYLNGLCTNS